MPSTLKIPFYLPSTPSGPLYLTVDVHEIEGGGFWGEVRQFPGCIAQAETLELTFRWSSPQFPGIFRRARTRLRQPVGSRVKAQEANDRALRLCQLGHHHLRLPVSDPYFVPLDRREHLDHPMRRRTRALPIFRI